MRARDIEWSEGEESNREREIQTDNWIDSVKEIKKVRKREMGENTRLE